MEVRGNGNNLYLITEGGPQGWQALIRNGPPGWTRATTVPPPTTYSGSYAETARSRKGRRNPGGCWYV
jgi:hypothetical protein